MVQDIIDMIQELQGLHVGAWVKSSPVAIFPFEDAPWFVAVGQIIEVLNRPNGRLFLVRVDNDSSTGWR